MRVRPRRPRACRVRPSFLLGALRQSLGRVRDWGPLTPLPRRYRAFVAVPELCAHPLLAPVRVPLDELQCTAPHRA